MSDVIMEIHNYLKLVMEKIKRGKKDLIAGLRADISYQVGLNVNKQKKELAEFKSMLSTDMNRWTAQRSDLQRDINRLDLEVKALKVRVG